MRTAAGILIAIGFLVAMVYVSLGETEVRCEICMDFGGARACRAASGADEIAATQIAISTACAVLAGGRTPNIQCQATRPSSRVCE